MHQECPVFAGILLNSNRFGPCAFLLFRSPADYLQATLAK
jgi:hypothetical protein